MTVQLCRSVAAVVVPLMSPAEAVQATAQLLTAVRATSPDVAMRIFARVTEQLSQVLTQELRVLFERTTAVDQRWLA